MAGEEVVGGIVGFLRLDADDFHREITRAIAEVKVLKGMDARVKVEAVGAQKMSRDLDRIGKSAEGTGRQVVAMNRSFSGGGGLLSPQVIVGGLVAGMSLLGPVTAAATAAMAGFVGVVGTGVLAYQGFQKEVEEGTALGVAIQGEIEGIAAGFDALGSSAARAMSGDVLAGLNDLREFLPTINDDVEVLAGSLGRAFRISTGGLISGLENAMPLLQDGGKYAEILATKFAEFTQSQDFKDFIDYARDRLPAVTDAFVSLGTGVKDLAVGLAPVGDELIALIDVFGKAASAVGWVIGAIEKLDEATKLPGFDNEKASVEAATSAVQTHTASVANLSAIQAPLASGLGATNTALSAAQEKHRTTAAAAADATLAMQLEGDAAGLLKQQLDILNGKALNVAQAQTNAASATIGLTKSFKENGTTLSTNTEKGIANRQAIERKIQADQALAEAVAKSTGSTKAGTESLKSSKAQLEDTLRSQGKLTDKVQAYINKLYQVPKKVPPTRLEVEKSAAEASLKAFQKAVNSLKGKTIEVRIAYTETRPGGGKSTAGGLTFADGGEIRSRAKSIPGYAGGTLVGPGSGRSDSILAGIAGTGELIRVSNGEFISTDASRRRNRAALEAGNNGAKLGVVSGGGGASDGLVDLSPASIAALAAAMSRVNVKSTVSAGAFDSAMAVGLM